jgi:hypothetical protein
MNVINFNNKACERIRQYFDSYIDNELLVETNHEVLRHLEGCEDCRHVLESRIRLKQTVKRVVEREETPALLAESILETIRGSARRNFFPSDFGRWPTIAAAALVLTFGILLAARVNNVFDPLTARSLDGFQLISAEAREIMRVGLIDHIHCTLLAKKWMQPLTVEKMEQASGRTALGPEFIGLVSLVREGVGSNFRIIQGHRCFVNGREYVHLILTGDKAEILSLVITERAGESFARANLASALKATDVPLYRTAQGQLQIAGFETDRYLAFVISNLAETDNLRVASSLAPSVYSFLRRAA